MPSCSRPSRSSLSQVLFKSNRVLMRVSERFNQQSMHKFSSISTQNVSCCRLIVLCAMLQKCICDSDTKCLQTRVLRRRCVHSCFQIALTPDLWSALSQTVEFWGQKLEDVRRKQTSTLPFTLIYQLSREVSTRKYHSLQCAPNMFPTQSETAPEP